MYFFLTFVTMILTCACWKKLLPQARFFIGMTLGTIISFNLIFNFLFSTTYENMWRYNVYSLPLFLCYVALIFNANYQYAKPFIKEHSFVTKALISFVLIFYCLPLSFSMLKTYLVIWNIYHETAKSNAGLVRAFIKEEHPKFIYLNDGTHTVLLDYPIKQVFKDATNEQLEQINKILPEPIEYLLLRPTDWLFQNNKDLILMASPIINDQYTFCGYNKETQTFGYRINK